MDPYIPLFAALAGALIGAAASVVTIIVQAHYQNKREMTKEAVALALEDWKIRLGILKEKGGTVPPLAIFIEYHTKLMRLAEKGHITPANVKQLSAEQDELLKAFSEIKSKQAKPTA